jgi:hypothetical protein
MMERLLEIRKKFLEIYPKFAFTPFGNICIEYCGEGQHDMTGLHLSFPDEKRFVGHGDKIKIPLDYRIGIMRDFCKKPEALRYSGAFLLEISLAYIMSVSATKCFEKNNYVPAEIILNFLPSSNQSLFVCGDQHYRIHASEHFNYGIKNIIGMNSETTGNFHSSWHDIVEYAFDACKKQIGRIPSFIKIGRLTTYKYEILQWNGNIYLLYPINKERDIFLVYSPYEEYCDEVCTPFRRKQWEEIIRGIPK